MGLPTQFETVELGRFHHPVGADDLPGLVLIHDVWGLSPHSCDLAAELASEGFGVLEIDLYRNHAKEPIEDPGQQIRSLVDSEIVADLESGADWLKADSVVCRGRSVGVVGVCMGGTFTLLAACQSDRFAAATPFYGILSYDEGLIAGPDGRDFTRKAVSPVEAAPNLRTPLLASFGGQDTFVPDEHVAALEVGFVASGTAFEIDRYPEAGHAFLNRTREDAYHEESAQAAWARVTRFLHDRLD